MVISLVAAVALTQSGLSLTPVKTTEFKVIAVAPGPGNTFLCSTEDNMIRVIDAATGATKFQLAGHPQPAYALAANRQGTLYATGDETGRIYFWNSAGKKVREVSRERAHTRGIQFLSFSADGKTLASTGADDFIFEWNTATAAQLRKVAGEGAVVESGQFAGSNLFAASQVKGMFGYSASLGRIGAWNAHHGQGMQDLAVDNSGSRGVTAGRDGTVAFWNLTKRTKMSESAGHEDCVMHVAMAPNGAVAASSGVDGKVNFWSVGSGSRVVSLGGQSSVGAPICFTGNGAYFASSNAGDKLVIYKLNKPQGAGTSASKGKKKRK